jgi:hypothetical protein
MPAQPAPVSPTPGGPASAAGAPTEAQPQGNAVPPSPAPGEPSSPVERARVHYERGLQLFNEENYDAALFEFERAYELSPSYKILYNMGRIQRQQNNYAAAMRSYARYLSEGGTTVPPERRTEVEREIEILKPRVARVTVIVNVDDADVYSDDTPVCTATIESSCFGKSPLKAPLVVNGGRHKITAVKRGYTTATSLISVVGSDAIDVKLELISLDRPPAPPTNPWVTPAIIGWGLTGAGLITAGVTAVLATKASDKQTSAVGMFGATRSSLDAAREKTHTLGNVTDGFLIGSAVAAGVSTYLTIRAFGWKKKETNGDITVGANGFHFDGRF